MLAFLLACTGPDESKNVFDTVDTGTPECGPVRGANAILMYNSADINTVHYPDEEPDDEVTSGVAGPVGDPYLFVAVQEGDVFRSEDAGCTWSEVGSLPNGDWALLAADTRVYAFERATGDAALSDDLGGSWSPFDPAGAFVSTPVPAVTDMNWLRGVQAGGVATSTDGGGGWTITGDLPAGTPVSAGFYEGDLDQGILSTGTALWTTQTGGLSWEDRTKVAGAEIGDLTAVHAVAISPTNPDVMAVVISGLDGVYTLLRSADGGGSWQRIADSDGIGLDERSGLWIDPEDAEQVITVYSDPGAEFPLHLNVSAAGVGTRIVKTAVFDTMTQLVFSAGEDGRWIAGVLVGG